MHLGRCSLISYTCFFKKFHLYLANTNIYYVNRSTIISDSCTIYPIENNKFLNWKLQFSICLLKFCIFWGTRTTISRELHIYIIGNAEKRADFRTTCYRIRSGHWFRSVLAKSESEKWLLNKIECRSVENRSTIEWSVVGRGHPVCMRAIQSDTSPDPVDLSRI